MPIAITQAGPDSSQGIVLIHSLLASSLHWEKQLASELTDSLKLVSLDVRGHGASGKPWDADSYINSDMYADDIAAVISAADVDKPLLVAWAYGGLYAMDYIRKYGTSGLSGLVLVNATAGFEEPPEPAEDTPERQAQIARSTSPNIETIMNWTDGYVSFLTGTDPSKPDEDFLRIKMSSLMTPHYVRPYFRQRNTDNRDLLKKVDLPVLFIVGSNEVMSPPEKVQLTLPPDYPHL